jgi:hypothetical protein
MICTPPLPAASAQCTTSLDSTKLPDGPHTLSVTATDAAGNTATQSIQITVDNTPPAVTCTAPLAGSKVRTPVTITCGATDVTSGVRTLTIAVDGLLISQLTGPAQPMVQISTKTPLKKGPHTLVTTGWDDAGNMGRLARSFRVQ